MESNKISPDDVTEREKIAALKTLGEELLTSFNIKDKQLRVSTKLNNRTMLILILHSVLLVITISLFCYIIFKPIPATVRDINRIQKENEDKENRNYLRLDRIMNEFLAQDSLIRKLKK